jgi:hypothetical protein
MIPLAGADDLNRVPPPDWASSATTGTVRAPRTLAVMIPTCTGA